MVQLFLTLRQRRAVMKKKNLLWVGIGAALATAAALFLVNRNKKEENKKPPKNAPQVPVENPGDQSDFPQSASESELG